jgi:hypothetical protein
MWGIRLLQACVLLAIIAAVALSGCASTKADKDDPDQGGHTANPGTGGNNANPVTGGNNANPGQGGNNNNANPAAPAGVADLVSQGTRISYDGYSAFATVVGDHKEYSSATHTRWDVTVN